MTSVTERQFASDIFLLFLAQFLFEQNKTVTEKVVIFIELLHIQKKKKKTEVFQVLRWLLDCPLGSIDTAASIIGACG